MRTIQLPVPEEDYRYVERVLVRGLTFAPDGRTLVALLGDPRACVHVVWWDLQHCVAVETLDGGVLINDGSDRWADPALSPDHRFLARAASNRHATVDWVTLTDRTAVPFVRRNLGFGGEPSSVRFLRFSPDGRFLFAAGVADDQGEGGEPRDVVAWWDLTALPGRDPPGEPAHVLEPAGRLFLPDPATGVASFEVAPGKDGCSVAVGGDGWVRGYRFDGNRQSPAWSLEGFRHRVSGMAFSPDGARLAASASVNVTLYDLATGSRKEILTVDEGSVSALAFSPSGRTLATALETGTVRLHRLPSGASSRPFAWDLRSVCALAFSPDGCLCAAGGEGGRIALWDVDD